MRIPQDSLAIYSDNPKQNKGEPKVLRDFFELMNCGLSKVV